MRPNGAMRTAVLVALWTLSVAPMAETSDKATPPPGSHDGATSQVQPNTNAPTVSTPDGNTSANAPSSNAAAGNAAQPPAASAPISGFSDAQRKGMITANIAFGKDEADGFWPLYRDYRRDIGRLLDRRAKAIAQYTEIFRSMTGDQAKSILEDFLQSDEEIAKVKRDYLKKFRKFLPDTKLTRFYLIDAKIDLADEAMLMTKVQTIGEAPR